MTFGEYLGLLFKSATGWLGWSPSEALASPMPMIEAAMEGRIEMLKAIFGGGEAKERETQPLPASTVAKQARAVFASAGSRKVKRNGP